MLQLVVEKSLEAEGWLFTSFSAKYLTASVSTNATTLAMFKAPISVAALMISNLSRTQSSEMGSCCISSSNSGFASEDRSQSTSQNALGKSNKFSADVKSRRRSTKFWLLTVKIFASPHASPGLPNAAPNDRRDETDAVTASRSHTHVGT